MVPITIDVDKIIQVGTTAAQIDAGDNCHLDAVMLQTSLDQLSLDDLRLTLSKMLET